jgi:ATP-binding cassette, subfamily F, member 3
MIKANKITLSFLEQKIFDNISFNINSSERIGLVGRNGSGKSTLFKIIQKTQLLDSGTICIEKNKKIAYVPQDIVLNSSRSVFDEAFLAFEDIFKLEEEKKYLDKLFSTKNICFEQDDIDRYANINLKLNELNVDKAKVQTKNVLNGLGFSNHQMSEPVDSFSLGWKMRIMLAKLLLQKADFYLFDEPTNHLDIVTKDWFLGFLKKAKFGFLLVCHDRYFLDNLVEKIFELDRGKLFVYKGNYSSFIPQKEKVKKELELAFRQQQKDIKKKQATINRFRASASKAKMAQKMMKDLDRVKLVEVESDQKNIKFNFIKTLRSGKEVLHVENLGFAFGDKKIFDNISFTINRDERVALIAPNGIGKTTLFNIICGNYKSQKGKITLGHNVSVAIFEQDQDKVLNKNKTIISEVEDSASRESRPFVRKFLGAFLFRGEDVEKRISVLSGGEKNRVAMVKTLLKQANLLMLDEPTNHLDIESKEVLLHALQQYSGTIFFVSHDRDFLNHLATRILELTPNGIESYSGNYDDYLYQKAEREKLNSHGLGIDCDASVAKKSGQINNRNNYEQRKKIKKIENKIERLEKEKGDLNRKLEKITYEDEDFNEIYKKILDIEKQLSIFWLKLDNLYN